MSQAIGQFEPRLRSVRARKFSDYPQVPRVYIDVAKLLSSPLMLGPPCCDELMALVQHLFTEEEAGVVRHLGMYKGRRAEEVARAERRPLEQVEPILTRLLREKHAIVAGGPDDDLKYRILPIMPGMFEMILISHTIETLTDWHRRYIELFEALYETGYSIEYNERPTPAVRYLPVEKAIEAHPMALPTDKLAIVLDRFDKFGIGQCQCRLAMASLGRGCGKPLGNCLVMGEWADRGIQDGWLRQVSMKEALEIKREAEYHGMVNWMMNVEATKGQSSCSCCGCCCHALRSVSEFSSPSIMAPPHFLPKLDAAKCIHCGKCAKACPMKAVVVDPQQKTYQHLIERCIGCGLCVLACERQKALTMEAVPDYRMPYRSWFSYIAHAAPGAIRTSFKIWRQRP